MLAKIGGEIIEQLGVRRPLALRPEILGGGHDTASEHLLPEPIHGYARYQRIRGRGQPFGELKPGFRRTRRKEGGRSGLDFSAVTPIIAAKRNVRYRRFGIVLHGVGLGDYRESF